MQPVSAVRIAKIPGRTNRLVTTDMGDFWLLPDDDILAVQTGTLLASHPQHADLQARGALGPRSSGQRQLDEAVIATRKHQAFIGPTLHIFVVTLRCDHACHYCQVSRAAVGAAGFDMSVETATAAVDRVFESPAQDLTIEFQGGEPALRFDLVRMVVGLAERRNLAEGKNLAFTLVSTLHHLTDDDLTFCRDHRIHISTSLDGPQPLHEQQRPNATRDSWTRTAASLDRARGVLGLEGVSALPTITRAALSDPRGIVDTYLEWGFRSVFLRPISPYGFARKTAKAIGYSMDAFANFYAEALDYMLELNRLGVEVRETYASIALRRILTPFDGGYIDLRSPAAAGINVLVYNYDGHVFPSDEARMADEGGDHRFRLGRVTETLDDLMASQAMAWLATGAVAERLPGCRDCAFVPYCGADPVYHAAAHGDPVGNRADSDFCKRHTALFDLLFGLIDQGDPETLRTFAGWGLGIPRHVVLSAGHFEA